MKSISNLLSMLIYETKSSIPTNEPVVYNHKTHNGEVWQVIIGKLPEETVIAREVPKLKVV